MAIPRFKFTISIAVLVILSTKPCLCLSKCHPRESESLLSFKAALNRSHSILSSWVNGTDCCTLWDGVLCDNHTGHVYSLDLEINALSNFYGGIISDTICNLHFLTDLSLREIGLTGTVPPCLGNLSYLEYIDLSDNLLSGMIPSTICLLTKVTNLLLRGNQFSGNIPSCLGNLSSLSFLWLQSNQLSGSIPSSMGNLFSLGIMVLSNNQLSGQIPVSLGNLSSLARMDVSFNQLSGAIPSSFATMSSLIELTANGNAFNDRNLSWQLPSSMEDLSLSLDYNQTISETLFDNLPNLKNLYLSNCALKISSTWIPPFQLEYLDLTLCNIDGPIPQWLSTQFSLEDLTLVDDNLVGEIPPWLGDSSPLEYLNLSNNNLQGPIYLKNSAYAMRVLDLSGNALLGRMPSVWPSALEVLMLNNNSLAGNIPPDLCSLRGLQKLNLANNKFDGTIPQCLASSRLLILNLASNGLQGNIPRGLCPWSLIVRKNKLGGLFPSWITNCRELKILDIGDNLFAGEIPRSIGNLSALEVLVMKDNNFSGSIPSDIGQLKQLHILDLSSNNISGFIPHSIVTLQAMSITTEYGFMLNESYDALGYPDSYFGSYYDDLDMIIKGTNQHYPYVLSTLRFIDLSRNQLNGDIPSDFGNLMGLRYLNLSMNNLNGIIPSSFGEMSQLESLDLSANKLSGNIPWQLQSLSSLAYLNFSTNNLSGGIPQGGQMITFEESSYSRNPNLWGCPLPRNCSWPKFSPPPPDLVGDSEDFNEEEIPWYWIGVGLSHGMGFAGVVLLLVLKTNWRRKYIKWVDMILKFLIPSFRNRKL